MKAKSEKYQTDNLIKLDLKSFISDDINDQLLAKDDTETHFLSINKDMNSHSDEMKF